MVHLIVRNDSRLKGLYRTDDLERLIRKVCDGESFSENAELSLLLCDDDVITELNQTYRKKEGPTDVLSFGYSSQDNLPEDVPAPSFNVLGDIVISLETVERLCEGERGAMRDEIRLLFCHGLLHLLGYVHETKTQQAEMRSKQALYLGISEGAAWRSKPL